MGDGDTQPWAEGTEPAPSLPQAAQVLPSQRAITSCGHPLGCRNGKAPGAAPLADVGFNWVGPWGPLSFPALGRVWGDPLLPRVWGSAQAHPSSQMAGDIRLIHPNSPPAGLSTARPPAHRRFGNMGVVWGGGAGADAGGQRCSPYQGRMGDVPHLPLCAPMCSGAGGLLDTPHVGFNSGGHGPASSSGRDVIARIVSCGAGTPRDGLGMHGSPTGSSQRWAALCTHSHPLP